MWARFAVGEPRFEKNKSSRRVGAKCLHNVSIDHGELFTVNDFIRTMRRQERLHVCLLCLVNKELRDVSWPTTLGRMFGYGEFVVKHWKPRGVSRYLSIDNL